MAWRELRERHNALTRAQLERFRGREVKQTGDGFLAVFDGPARAIRCACEVRDEARELGLEIRAGIHTGECEITGDDLAGLAVHVAARVAAKAQPNEVLVSGTVRDLVMGSGVELVERGVQELKGIPGEWRLFAVGSAADQQPPSEQLSPVQPGLTDRIARLLARRAPGLARAGNRVTRGRPHA